MYETFGTLLFTYCIIVSTANPLAAAFSLFAMILIFGSVTGGHFNPAVSLGVLIWQVFKKPSEGRERDPCKKLILCFLVILGQCLGAVLGAVLAGYVLKVNGNVPKEYVPVLAPENTQATSALNGFTEDFQTFFSQALCTFIFVLVILMLKGKKTGHTKDAILLAFSVAVTLWALIKLDYHTGACFNPAVAIGQTYF